MSAPDADRARRVGAELGENCTPRVPQPGDDLDLTDPKVWAIWTLGYLAGIRYGIPVGYTQGLALLDEAGALLASQRPADAIEAAAARRRRTEYTRRPETPEQIAARARSSWARVEREIAEKGRRAG